LRREGKKKSRHRNFGDGSEKTIIMYSIKDVVFSYLKKGTEQPRGGGPQKREGRERKVRPGTESTAAKRRYGRNDRFRSQRSGRNRGGEKGSEPVDREKEMYDEG